MWLMTDEMSAFILREFFKNLPFISSFWSMYYISVALNSWLLYAGLIGEYWHEVITTDCVYKDGKYHQMALVGFGTQTTELGL